MLLPLSSLVLLPMLSIQRQDRRDYGSYSYSQKIALGLLAPVGASERAKFSAQTGQKRNKMHATMIQLLAVVTVVGGGLFIKACSAE